LLCEGETAGSHLDLGFMFWRARLANSRPRWFANYCGEFSN
jgi:hypothetical protein